MTEQKRDPRKGPSAYAVIASHFGVGQNALPPAAAKPIAEVVAPAPAVGEPGCDVVCRAEVLRVLRSLGDQDADLALYGAADNARAREYGEAAATRACCAIAIMPAAHPSEALAAAEARIASQAAELARVTGLHEDAVRSHNRFAAGLVEAEARALAAEADLEKMRRALEQIHNCGQSAEPDHWKFRCMARETAREALSPRLSDARPQGHVEIAHDGFAGDIIGHYTTREGKDGVVVQQDGTRVVHVYGEKWLRLSDAEGKGL